MNKTKKILLGAACLLTAASLYADPADVREGLVAYWPLNSGTGANPMTTPDVVAGNDMSGPMDSSSAFAGGRYGNALQLDGVSTYVAVYNTGTDTGLPVGDHGSWSFSVWVKGLPQADDQREIFGETTTWYTNLRYEMTTAYAKPGKLWYWIRDAGGVMRNDFQGTTNCLDSTWHHVAYTYNVNSGKFLVYVDGYPDETNTFFYPQGVGADVDSIGARIRSNGILKFFAGAVDDVAVWARDLSQSEIQNVMNNSIATPVPQFKPAITRSPKSVSASVGDTINLVANCYGTRPLYYQWLMNGTNLPGANTTTLAVPSVTNNSGQYQLVISNYVGVITSAVAQVSVTAFGPPNLTNGIIAYYPCDTINAAGKTPELISGYDMPLFGGMNSGNIVAGKWGSALSFDQTVPQYGKRVFAPGDAMPGIRGMNCSISFWANYNGSIFENGYLLSEASSTDSDQILGIGTTFGGPAHILIRTPTGAQLTAADTTGMVVDGNWHNVIYCQHDIGGGNISAMIYVDGVLETGFTPVSSPLLQPDSLGFCINAGASLGSPGAGILDEVVEWNRLLSPAEVAMIQTNHITNPPSIVRPLAITSFTADLPAVVSGDSTSLRWDVPGNITSATISSGVGDVTALTLAGDGTANISVSVANTTTYQLTVVRDTGALGHEVVSKSVRIGTIAGVAPGWALVDNFDFYSPGLAGTNGTWNAVGIAGTSKIVQPTGVNHMLGIYPWSSALGDGAVLNLHGLAVTPGQARTLFFRMIPLTPVVDNILEKVILTDRRFSGWGEFVNENSAGPALHSRYDLPTLTWGVGVSTDGSGGPVYDTSGLFTPGAVYKVWIDVTNVPIVNSPGSRGSDEEDLFSVYIQKEGDPGRTALVINGVSDRQLNYVSAGIYPTDPLDRLTLEANDNKCDAYYDDFYVSKTDILDTTPIGAGYTGPAPTVQFQWNGSAWQIVFEGTLQQSSSVTGGWSDVSGATSPYTVLTTGGDKMFYRAVLN